MPTTTQTIDWELISAMGISAAATKRDALKLTSGFMKSQEDAHGAGNPKWGSDTGPRYQVEINFYNHSGITAFPTGYEGFDPTALTPVRSAFYTPAVCGLLMKIGLTESYTYGQRPEALRRVVENRIVSSMGYLHRQWTRQIVAGGGSGFSQWGTLNGIDYSTGVFERTAVGAQSNTVGGLSKSTYAFAIGWNNVVVDMSNAFGTNSFRLFQALTQINRHKDSGKKVWLLSDAGTVNLQRSVQGQVMYVSEKDRDAGRTVPTYGGVKIYTETQMPVSTATGGASTNTYPLTGICLDTEDIYCAWYQGVNMEGHKLPSGYFGVGNWAPINGQTGIFGCPIMVAGQLITTDMGSSAAVIRGETY